MRSVAYKLDLLAAAAIHDTFHVSQLKLCPNPPIGAPSLPQHCQDLGTTKEPECILEKKMVKHRNAAATKVLVQWKGFPLIKQLGSFTRISSLSIQTLILEDKEPLKQGVV